MFTKKLADEFFGALREASVEFLRHHNLPIDQGSKRYLSWKEGCPIGITEHYTAGVTWKGTVRWLNDGPVHNSVSCQMLILDRMLPEYKDIVDKYPELQGLLNVTVLLLSDGIIPCWHAGWVNKLTFGIENRNVGHLRYDDNRWYWWAKNWSAEFPNVQLSKTPQVIGGRWWEPYTYEQICANIIVGQALYALYYPKLDKRWFLPHSATTGTKYDSGRAFPLHKVREAIFDMRDLNDLIWLYDYAESPDYMVESSDEEDREFVLEMAVRQEGRYDQITNEEDLDEAVRLTRSDFELLVKPGNWRKELGSVRRALQKLGYYVPSTASQVLDQDTALATYQFQRSIKTKPDKIPGPITQMALMNRLKRFGLA